MLTTRIRAILTSPLLHFFVLGGVVFAYYNFKNPPAERALAEEVLRLSEADAQRLTLEFMSARNRAPNPEELRAIIRDWATEEVLVREALALGLDQGDAMIRNRLRNKVEFLAEAPAAVLEPDDATLEAYYQANAARFSEDGELSFAQILLVPDAGPEEVQATKASLEQGADAATLNNSTMLPPQVDGMAIPMIERVFGKGFGGAVAALPLDQWSGPVESGFGKHLVRLEKRQDGALPPFAQMRDRVLAEWRAEQARTMREAYIGNLLQRYRLELPEFPDEAEQ